MKSYILIGALAGCASAGTKLEVKHLSPLEFTVRATDPNAQAITVDDDKVVGSLYTFSPAKCKGYDEVVARGTGDKTYGELVRVRDCIQDADGTEKKNRFDYADFTPSHEIEYGPNRVEVRLPTGECIRTTIRMTDRREAPKWSKVECERLEALK